MRVGWQCLMRVPCPACCRPGGGFQGMCASMARSWGLLLLAGLALAGGAATPAAAKPQPPRIQGFSLADVQVGASRRGLA